MASQRPEPIPAFEETLVRVFRERIKEIQEEEMTKALTAIRSRVASEVDSIALKVLDFYEIARDGRSLVITVKKEMPR